MSANDLWSTTYRLTKSRRSVIPLAIVGAHSFYDTLTNFLSLIGYWAGAFIAVILVEHWFFRKSDLRAYDPMIWNRPRELPSGLAAVGAAILCFGLVVPGMDQVWFVGELSRLCKLDSGTHDARRAHCKDHRRPRLRVCLLRDCDSLHTLQNAGDQDQETAVGGGISWVLHKQSGTKIDV